MTNIRRNPRGTVRNTTDFAGMVAGIVGPLGSSSFYLSNVERALSEMESGIGPANTSAIEGTTRRLGGRAGTAGLSPLGTSSSPISVGSVRSPGHRQLIPARLAQKDSHSMRFCKISFTSLVSTNTRDRTANAAAAHGKANATYIVNKL